MLSLIFVAIELGGGGGGGDGGGDGDGDGDCDDNDQNGNGVSGIVMVGDQGHGGRSRSRWLPQSSSSLRTSSSLIGLRNSLLIDHLAMLIHRISWIMLIERFNFCYCYCYCFVFCFVLFFFFFWLEIRISRILVASCRKFLCLEVST